ncbi:MAG: cyanophycinase [Bacteroidota bacterium]
MMQHKWINLYLMLALSCTNIGENEAQDKRNEAQVGPSNGSLLIVGGGQLSEDILLKFIELAGGPTAPMVVIPTAAGWRNYSQEQGDFLRRLGAEKVTVLHTDDPQVADTDAFIAPLLEAKGVWFTGGRQWRLVDAYANTQAEQMFWNVLERGGVIGGSSAGATIQGSYLARGDTRHNQIMMGDHEAGFGFLKNTAIDQHVLARNRQFDLFQILEKRPELLGIGIDENTAMVVKGDQFEVIGASYVLVYDGTFWSREGSDRKKLPDKNALFYFLKAGDRYDLLKRSILE